MIHRVTGELADLAGKTAAEAAAVLRNGRRALPKALSGRMRGRLRRALAELTVTIGRTATIVAQTRSRLAGQLPDSATRLVSLHDPDARPIRKGRIDRPVEFGYGTTVVSMPWMGWFVVTPPTSWSTSTVVSDRGAILSPPYPPEMTTPAAIASDIFRTGAMPTNATPSVPAVGPGASCDDADDGADDSDGCEEDGRTQQCQAVGDDRGIVPAMFQVPIMARTASRMKIAPMAELTPPIAASPIAEAVWPFL